ncbi:MAG: RNA recognition motif domain-containing protein [Acidiferrobacter sp.]
MNLYVGNLARTVTETDLEVIFDGLGHIVFTRLAPDDGGIDTRGYAFVAVANPAQAELAVGSMNGKYLKGQRLIVRAVVDGARQARALQAPGGHTFPLRSTRLHVVKDVPAAD